MSSPHPLPVNNRWKREKMSSPNPPQNRPMSRNRRWNNPPKNTRFRTTNRRSRIRKNNSSFPYKNKPRTFLLNQDDFPTLGGRNKKIPPPPIATSIAPTLEWKNAAMRGVTAPEPVKDDTTPLPPEIPEPFWGEDGGCVLDKYDYPPFSPAEELDT